jgi:VCBS repeat-containing protein
VITVANGAALDYETTPSFVLTIQASDGTQSDTAQVTINLNNLNETPVLGVNAGTLVNEGSAGNVITSAMLLVLDGDTPAGSLVYTIGAGVANGTLFVNGVAAGVGATFTQADINAGLVTYSHDGSETLADAFTFTVSDGGTTIGPATFAITVAGVNDAPAVNDQALPNLAENSANGTVVGSVVATDADSPGLAYSITGGNTGGAFAIDPSTGIVTVANAGALDFEASPTFTLTVLVDDGAGGTDTAQVTINLTNVNEAPLVAVPGAQGGTEDVALPIGGISVADPEANLSAVTLTVANGGLTVSLVGSASISGGANGSGTVVLSGSQADINATLASLVYLGNPDYNGADTLTVTTLDTLGATGGGSVAIGLAGVNDLPSQTLPGAQAAAEDTPLGIPGISVADVDGNVASVTLTVGNGTLTVAPAGGAAAAGNGTGTIVLSGSQAAINATLASLVYASSPNWSGADTLTVTTVDGGGVTISGSAPITVAAVNDAPQLVNSSLAVSAGSTVTIDTTNLGATDIDNAWSTLVYDVSQIQNGYFQLTAAPGAAVTAFTQADVAAGLVQFVASGNGAPAFSVSVSDGSLVDGPRAATIFYAGGGLLPGGGAGGNPPTGQPPVADPAPLPPGTPVASALVDPTAVNFIRNPTVPPVSVDAREAPVDLVEKKKEQTRIVAQDDSYDAKAGGQLSVPATAGVLANDRGVDARSVSIRVTQMPANGALSLDTNGSFVYTPVPGFAGSDTFMYEVRTADGRTATATVTLVVRGASDAEKVREDGIGGPQREENDRPADPVVEAELKLHVPAGRGQIDDEAGEEITVILNSVKITGIALSVGAVWWAARASGLIASLLASAPAWRHLDPLPVLGRAQDGDDAEWVEPEDVEAKRDEQAVSSVLGST